MTLSTINGHLHNSANLKISEKAFQQAVTDLAGYAGWALQYHTLNSRGSTAGFPDLVLLRPPELIMVELKAEKGRVSVAQWEWLEQLGLCGVEVYCWRPSDWPEVEARLTAPRPTPIALAA